MSILRKAKDNLFICVVVLAYIGTFIVKPEMGITSVENSAYYIKEMLMVMPVIFILTALLDLWLPKDRVIRYLGKDAGAKGVFFSFVLGSISAGPVYAAFPMCVMLHKKGASIRSLVVILSSWAVIKIPMLLNEMKFLGLKFMAIRWVLTVIAIIIFSWMTAKVVKDEDLPENISIQNGVFLHRDACMGCSLCVSDYPELFEMVGRKARIKQGSEPNDKDRLRQVIEACPVKAISSNSSNSL